MKTEFNIQKITSHQFWNTGVEVKSKEEANEIWMGIELTTPKPGLSVLYDINTEKAKVLDEGFDCDLELTDDEMKIISDYAKNIKQ